MSVRPTTVTAAVILLVLLSVSDLPLPYQVLFPGADEVPDFVVYSGIVLAIAGFVVAVGLWMLKRWSYRATQVVGVLNFLLSLPGVFAAPGVALRAFIAVTAVAALVLVWLVMRPSARRALGAA
jgi:hypothetical protein